MAATSLTNTRPVALGVRLPVFIASGDLLGVQCGPGAGSSLVLLPQFRIRCVLGVMALTLIFTLGVGASCSLRVVGDEDALAVGVVVSQDTLVGAHPAP